MKHILTSLCLACITCYMQAQQIKRVLFVGNSYVTVNNLPLVVSNIAAAHGDSVYYDSSAPGGYTFQQHCANGSTLLKIAQGNWDYVALQEQSQIPSFPPAQVASDCLPYAHVLDSLVHAANSCTETVFYMTWGRKNGDASNCAAYPPLCTYTGMQGRLRDSYLLMAQQNNANVAPVGCAWREVRNQNPAFDLYQADESHPSIHGTYLAACVFYSTFFKKPVSSLAYTLGIPPTEAALIQQQCNQLVFDSLQTWFGNGNIPFASFNSSQNLTTYQFNNTSINSIYYHWNFGDGSTSTVANPQHTYTANGIYPVTLTAFTTCDSSVYVDTIAINTVGIVETGLTVLQLKCNNFTFSVSPSFRPISIEVFLPDGRLIASKKHFSKLKVRSVSGIYVLKVSLEDSKVYHGKITIDADGNGTTVLQTY